ncbi:MAG: hypothetical protein AAGC46_05965 [Solirubrobacteraceae bacterium]|nr:hypothetical protein [Patulibacter sp.]
MSSPSRIAAFIATALSLAVPGAASASRPPLDPCPSVVVGTIRHVIGPSDLSCGRSEAIVGAVWAGRSTPRVRDARKPSKRSIRVPGHRGWHCWTAGLVAPAGSVECKRGRAWIDSTGYVDAADADVPSSVAVYDDASEPTPRQRPGSLNGPSGRRADGSDDDSVALLSAQWSQWGGAVATGTAVYRWNSADGEQEQDYPVAVSLDEGVLCQGRRRYTRVTATFTGGVPPHFPATIRFRPYPSGCLVLGIADPA